VKLLRERAAVCRTVRRFFEARGFLEVTTPVLLASPGLDVHLDAFEVTGGDRGRARWLSTSPEYQMKRLLADGWDRIYQIAPCFRRGEVGRLHNPEFSMLEWYRANAGVEDVMRDTEQLLADATAGRVRLGERSVDTRPPLPRIAVCDAFERFAGWSCEQTLEAATNDETRYFHEIVQTIEPALERMDKAVFLVDFPISQSSLARANPGNPRVAERFELYVAGVELCNGFGELVDASEQRARFERDRSERARRGLPVYPLDERLLEVLARMPPSGGNAVGLDRLVALACGRRDIAPVVSFTTDEL
jgi:elongation factor P--(R)-beta-lysine ligase